MSNVALKWTGAGSKMFIGRDSFGHVLLSGSWPSEEADWQEWKAVKPSDLLLLSLASCSAYDVVLILERQRQQLRDLLVEVQGTQMEEAPFAFTAIHLNYILEGNDLDARKVERAIVLSQEKYCSVAATLRPTVTLTHTFRIS